MKHNNHIKLLAAILLSIPLTLIAANNQISYLAQYMDNVTIGTDTLGGMVYSTISYGDLFNDGLPGFPSLPVDYINFSVPYNATNFTVTASLNRWASSNLDYMIYPCQMSRMMCDTTPVVMTPPDSLAYYLGNSYPNEYAWIADEGYLMGENHIVTVAVMPFSYIHSSNSDVLKKARNVSVRLNYELSDSLAMYTLVRNDDALRQEGFELTKRMVVNPNNVITFAGPSPSNIDTAGLVINPINPGNGINSNGFAGDIPPIIGPGFDSTYVDPTPGSIYFGEYPYLIVTTQEFIQPLRRLVALKKQKGYNVKVVTMNDVLNNDYAHYGDCVRMPDGTLQSDTTDVGRLRQFLRLYYLSHGTKYVFLVGNGVPYKYATALTPNGDTIHDFSTDFYLSELNTVWQQNQVIKKIDFHPELFVGRLLSSTKEQVLNYIDKLLQYELNPGNGNYAYLKRILYTEGLEMQDESCVSKAHNNYKHLFSESINLQEMESYPFPSGEDVVNVINNQKYGYLSIMNHAEPSGFITYGFRTARYPNATSYYYLWAIDTLHSVFDNRVYSLDPHTNNGINCIKNESYPNICYSIGCKTMPFGLLPHYENVSINIGESFTTGKNYGGPAFLGYTEESNSFVSNRLELLFAQQLIDGKYKVGEAESFSKNNFRLNHYIPLAHNLLGDPEFEIWTDIPQLYSEIIVTRTDNSISINGLENTDPTIIAYFDNNGHVSTQKASSNTTLSTVSPNGSIMLYKHNHIPYIAPLLLQNYNIAQSQYVIASDVTAGSSIDNARTNGDVTVKSGVEYEMEFSGTVRLEDGFKVEKGATFTINPSCF